MDFSNFDIIWVESCAYLSETGISKHRHAFFHFLYVDSGAGKITIGDDTYTMDAGSIYLVPPFVDHAFFNSAKTDLKTLEIKFFLNNSETAEATTKLPSCINVKSSPMKAILWTIIKEHTKQKPLSAKVISLNFQLLLTYLQRFGENMDSTEESDRKKLSPEIEKAVNYICEHLTEELNLEMLSGIVGFEKNYFLRKFKKQTNRTPIEYIREKRLEKAKGLLRYSDMNISQVALATGFKSVHYFSKVFLKCIGKGPMSYKDENKIR